MSAQIHSFDAAAIPNPDWPRVLVHNALANFARRHLHGHETLTAQLSTPRLDQALGLGELAWVETLQQLRPPLPLHSVPLQRLARDFHLQVADLFLLALCGEVEQSHELNMLLAALQAPDEGSRPTLHLLSAILRDQFGLGLPPGRLHQHALLRSGILQCEGDAPLPLRTLRTDPDLWNLLSNGSSYWPGVQAIAETYSLQINDSNAALIEQTASQLRQTRAPGLVIRGDVDNGRLCAVNLAQRLGLQAVNIDLSTWQASALPAAACRYAGWLPVIEHALSPGDQFELHSHAFFPMPVVLLTGNDGAVSNKDLLQLQLPKPQAEQRMALWHGLLGEAPSLDILADSALLDQQRITDIALQVRENIWPEAYTLGQRVARVRAQLGTHRLRTLAQPVERHVDADALVLNPNLSARFDALLQRCVQREQLWQQLGPTLGNTRNTGVRALFSGDSGTGKTLAASRLASALHAPLFRLDLASILDKFVGESEKRIGTLLDEAAANDVILLLDEADALFGRRSDGDGNGERFANMLTNFLLTRIENHPGIVILTSNSQARIDQAFTRRFDAVLEFTAPAFEERKRLWINHLGERSPGDKACTQLASYCDLAGGYIRNAVLNAAALQPVSDQVILDMRIIIAALHEEYRKLGRALPPALAQLRGDSDG